jgi:hypothetical protein
MRIEEAGFNEDVNSKSKEIVLLLPFGAID